MESKNTQSSDDMNMTFAIRGLKNQEHTITIEVLDGTLNVDMVGVLGGAFGNSTEGDPEDASSDQTEDGLSATPTPSPATSSEGNTSSTSDGSQTAMDSQEVKKGSVYTVNGGNYIVTNTAKKTVSYKAPAKKSVKTVTIPSTIKIKENGEDVAYKVTGISGKAFAKCKKLKKVIIGKNVKTIGKEAFRNCKSLRKIVIKSTKLKKAGKNAIKGIHKKAVITCPKKKVTAYRKLFSRKTGFKKSMKVKI